VNLLIFLIIISVFLYGFYKEVDFDFKTLFFQNSKTYQKELLLLTAYVLSIDGKVTQKELNFVYWFIEKNFGKKELLRSKHLLKVYLTKRIKIERSLNKIDYEEDKYTKTQILNYLIKITTIDGLLSNKELIALKEICKGIGLNLGILKSLLGSHSFITEKQREQQTKQQQSKTKSNYYQKQKKRTSKTKLQLSYSILGLSYGSTSSEIKKAYRKMVLLYHPDKIQHLDEAFKKSAKDKFIKINEAYDYLKMILKFK
jgi:DnaJ like chaperone protein